MGARLEFARGRLRFGRCCWELIENSPEVHRKNAGSSLGVHRRKSGVRGFIKRIPRVCRRDDWTMKIVC
ncbi:hypothetical protein B296_00037679 [Ensete ventricosum]|uniref:Uncharacterized protein n=1 Tax=Ensete ventricosum TaxID=4639 RepID=A0A426X3E0_ENSVE|nr:hypothetical protein B296_00037679 [Ensete ventricosum]